MSLSESQASRKRPQTEVITIASHIQSTLISNCLTEARWYEHVSACLTYHFQAAMIAAAWVRKTAELLRGTGIKVASFIDLPYGTMTGAGKAYEARRLIDEGAEEIDLMPNVSFLLSGMEKEYFEDISGVVEAAGAIPVKIMLELPLLNAQQRARAVALSIDAGVAYLKNASGGAVGVATPEDIRYLRRLAPSRVHIKASGGVKTAQHVKDLLEAGADLVGTSAAVDIIKELRGEQTAERKSSSSY